MLMASIPMLKPTLNPHDFLTLKTNGYNKHMTPEFDFNDPNSYRRPIATEFIDLHKDRLNWHWICQFQKLSEDFIELNSDRVVWGLISEYQKLSGDFLERNKHKLPLFWICQKQILSEEFIWRNAAKDNNFNWAIICRYQSLSESFIEKASGLVNWACVSIYQKLSEEFIERNADRVDWGMISIFQKLSEKFIERHAGRLNWNSINKYQKLSKEFRARHNLKLPKDNWLFTDKQTKRKAIENCDLYELDGDYVIAYKGIRSDGRSRYNFRYHYELGGIYEAHADHNLDNDDSFGLSAWTEYDAKQYCGQKLIKVKIHLDDVAALVHNGGKIRCTRLEVIEEL